MFYLLVGKIRKVPPKIQLPNNNRVKEVIIFFPIDENLFRLSLYSFREFDLNKDNIKYHFIINQKFQNMINLSGPNLIFVNHRKNKIKFCDPNQQNILTQNDIDVIVDLNIHFSFGPSKFISYLKSNIKIGFKSKFSDYFYNLQLEANNKGTVENSYQQIQHILNSL
ncbi:MAG: hypothetical protein CMG60_07010 [Candidatus Marinimicrobia bacterium]|nr:hypothetical protein [Candidatus Neomarinimicrobiota bacterium]|tara:strand:+ start:614 stop:1114 length:501 start_codon:yes stop_codon:yes gene_type:complete